MAKYKNILTGYINDSKKGNGQYLTITNVGEEDIILKSGDKLFLNKTPDHFIEKNPKIPAFSKSIKVDEQGENLVEQAKEVLGGESAKKDVNDDIPF